MKRSPPVKLLMPVLSEMSPEIKAINTRIDSLGYNMDTKMDSLGFKINTRIENIEAQIVSLRNEMKSDYIRLGDKLTSFKNETKSDFAGLLMSNFIYT